MKEIPRKVFYSMGEVIPLLDPEVGTHEQQMAVCDAFKELNAKLKAIRKEIAKEA